MKLVLKKVPTSSYSSLTYNLFGSLDKFDNYWGKCSLDEKTNILTIMQDVVTCKDYVVDTYAREQSSGRYNKKDWTKQERMSPTVYMTVTKDSLTKLVERVKTLLNPYEERHGFIPSQVLMVTEVECEGKDVTKIPGFSAFLTGMVVVKYDPKWMINITAMSTYLSCLRHFYRTNLVKENQTKLVFANSDLERRTHNEVTYYLGLNPQFRKIVDYYYNNPNEIIEDISEKYGESGNLITNRNKTGRIPAHGEAGFFTKLSFFINHASYNGKYEEYTDQYVFEKMIQACGLKSREEYNKLYLKYKKEVFTFPEKYRNNYENSKVFLVKEINEYLERKMQSV